METGVVWGRGCIYLVIIFRHGTTIGLWCFSESEHPSNSIWQAAIAGSLQGNPRKIGPSVNPARNREGA